MAFNLQPRGGKLNKVVARGMATTGRHGGVLQKAADTGGHKPQQKTAIKSDRGEFSIKG